VHHIITGDNFYQLFFTNKDISSLLPLEYGADNTSLFVTLKVEQEIFCIFLFIIHIFSNSSTNPTLFDVFPNNFILQRLEMTLTLFHLNTFLFYCTRRILSIAPLDKLQNFTSSNLYPARRTRTIYWSTFENCFKQNRLSFCKIFFPQTQNLVDNFVHFLLSLIFYFSNIKISYFFLN
jgi:hypothetical protein